MKKWYAVELIADGEGLNIDEEYTPNMLWQLPFETNYMKY